MSLETLAATLPDHARDLRLNLGTLAHEPSLTAQQRGGTFVACAIAARNPTLIRAVLAEFGPGLSEAALTAARGAAAIMSMNNVYYRATHVLGADYPNLPARLRMSLIGRPGVEKADFELWSLAVSAIHGCAMCLTSHEAVVREGGLTQEQVHSALRIAAVVHGVAVVLDAEAALAEPGLAAAA